MKTALKRLLKEHCGSEELILGEKQPDHWRKKALLIISPKMPSKPAAVAKGEMYKSPQVMLFFRAVYALVFQLPVFRDITSAGYGAAIQLQPCVQDSTPDGILFPCLRCHPSVL